jgi:hypothetical protein
MKLYRYQNFIKESKEDIDSICEKYNIRNYTIQKICRKYDIRNYKVNEDLSIDVEGNVYISGKGLTELPLKFRKVGGDFYCDNNNKLTSLEGSPREVGGDFYCSNNKLTSLEGSPHEVGGNFSCNNNKLKSLEGSPRSVGGYFYYYRNQLESLSGISKYISKGIDLETNQLRDVQGIKDGWRGEVWIDENPVYQIFKLFPYKRWDEVIEYLNEYEVIRDGKVVVIQALELVFHEMDLEVPEIEEIEGYEIQY